MLTFYTNASPQIKRLNVQVCKCAVCKARMPKRYTSPLPPFFTMVRRSLSPYRRNFLEPTVQTRSVSPFREIGSDANSRSKSKSIVLPNIRNNQKTTTKLVRGIERDQRVKSHYHHHVPRPRTRLKQSRVIQVRERQEEEQQQQLEEKEQPKQETKLEVSNIESENSSEIRDVVPASSKTLGLGPTLFIHRFIQKARKNSLETRRLKKVGIDKVAGDNKVTTQSQDSETSTRKPQRQASWGHLREQLMKAKISEAFASEKFIINGNRYTSLRHLGDGGYSRVVEVFNKNKELFALKIVNLDLSLGFAKKDLKNEVHILQKFSDSQQVIQLVDFELEVMEQKERLYMVLERGECDLSTILKSLETNELLTPTKLRFYWEEMLESVRTIHTKGIVHADLKPSNFVLVKGHLKIIDFGLSGILEDGKEFLERNFVGGTRDYMSPESLGAFIIEDGDYDYSAMKKSEFILKVGFKSDVWALGVILYQLVYKGIAPYSGLPGGRMGKLKALLDPNFPVDFDPVADEYLLDTMKLCLQKNPDQRPSPDQLLVHPFLRPT